jgi:hypothetical protein
MFSFQNLYRAYRVCRKNKTTTINAMKFEQNLLENLWDLSHQLQDKSYTIGASICFLAHSPKLREIFAADFRDRVVHHLLIGEIEPFYEQKFIYDVYNNRKAKGIHQALKRTEKFIRATREGCYLQLDIKGFFYHLNKDILFEKLLYDIEQSNLREHKRILWLAHRIIFYDPTTNYLFQGDKRDLLNLPPHKSLFKIPKNRGLPIGNLTSQFFANVYMNSFDHFVKRELKVKRYIRYVDDFVLFDRDRDRLFWCKKQIESYLARELKLTLRGDSRLRKVTQGLDFLGYIIRPDYTLVRRRVVHNYKYKKAQYLDAYEQQRGKMKLEEIKEFLSVQASFVAHCQHANSFNLYNKVGKINETNPFDYDRC